MSPIKRSLVRGERSQRRDNIREVGRQETTIECGESQKLPDLLSSGRDRNSMHSRQLIGISSDPLGVEDEPVWVR